MTKTPLPVTLWQALIQSNSLACAEHHSSIGQFWATVTTKTKDNFKQEKFSWKLMHFEWKKEGNSSFLLADLESVSLDYLQFSLVSLLA